VDELCSRLGAAGSHVLVYRWNGGANAGHTVVIDGRKFALHQLPSGSLHSGATAVLGKGMVIHPGDLVAEMRQIGPYLGEIRLVVDIQAVLSLDTHRAFEVILRDWESGGRGSTGRGISPAYADVLYRHPVRIRDLIAADWERRLGKHYDLYEAWINGLGGVLSTSLVPTLDSGMIAVGSKADFLSRLSAQIAEIRPHVEDSFPTVAAQWDDRNVGVVFEGAQAIGIDPRYGVYPDITASDPTYAGITASTDGCIRQEAIAVRAGTIKATYTSSVGARRLPTHMEEGLAHRIREDAHEYGATTRRPRDIAYIDLPCLRYFAYVSGMTHVVLTHLDIAYPDVSIKVCVDYQQDGRSVPYRPDQEYLNSVQPVYRELPSWDGRAIRGVDKLEKLPREAVQYIAFLSQGLGIPPLMGTTGPERDELISWIPE